LTNILRDVADDARSERCYLPQEDLRRFGLAPEDLRAGSANPRFRDLMAFEVGRAREYFARARRLLDHVELPGKPILAAMHRTYGSLLDEIERRDYDVQSGRIRLGRWRRMRIVLWSLIRYRWLAVRGSSEKSVAGEHTCHAQS
jgi:15-cis-phytoene synthase